MPTAESVAPVAGAASALRAEFAAELTVRNLRWIWWLVVTATGLLLVYIGMNLALPALRSERLLIAQLIDLGATVVTLVGLVWLRRQPPTLRWCRWFPVFYAALVFAVFDYYNLSALATSGENGAYILGVVALGVIVMLPPRVFLPLLLGNHVIYLFCVAQSAARPGVKLLAAMDGTAGVLVAGLASGLLYAARRRDFLRERQLAQANADLARVNAEMSDLMAIAAHDLRSPLEGVRRLLDVVRTRTEWSRTQVEAAVGTCIESCAGMVAFIGRLLDAHAVEAAVEKKLTLTVRDLREDVTAVVARAQAAAARKQQRVVSLLPAEPAPARTEPTALAQAIENLVMNALKFSPPGTTVECAVVAAGAAWWVEVRDEGPGVRPEERAVLFQKFNRGSARPTGGESSSGLGLFIVKTTVEAMGGRVTHVPRDGGGSVFRLEVLKQ